MLDPYTLEDEVESALRAMPFPEGTVIRKSPHDEAIARRPTIDVTFDETEIDATQYSERPRFRGPNAVSHKIMVEFSTGKGGSREDLKELSKVGYELPRVIQVAAMDEGLQWSVYWGGVEQLAFDGTAKDSPRTLRYILMIDEILA